MVIALESEFSIWIREDGYNFIGDSGVFSVGQGYTMLNPPARNYRQQNAFSIFSSIPSGEVQSGTLDLVTGLYLSDQASERILIYAMSTPIDSLRGSHTRGSDHGLMPEIFEDAQSGVLLAEYVRTGSFPGTTELAKIELTPEGVIWLNGLEDGAPFAIGYTVTNIGDTDHVMQSFSSSPGTAPTLTLTVVPETSEALFLGLTAAILCKVRRRVRA